MLQFFCMMFLHLFQAYLEIIKNSYFFSMYISKAFKYCYLNQNPTYFLNIKFDV